MKKSTLSLLYLTRLILSIGVHHVDFTVKFLWIARECYLATVRRPRGISVPDAIRIESQRGHVNALALRCIATEKTSGRLGHRIMAIRLQPLRETVKKQWLVVSG